MRQQADDIDFFILNFLFPSDHVHLAPEQNTNRQESSLFSNYGYYSALLYYPESRAAPLTAREGR